VVCQACATNIIVILRSSARSAERLEGWSQARSALPSFETAARNSARPPQDDVFVCYELRWYSQDEAVCQAGAATINK
jgi:hypothetical protein